MQDRSAGVGVIIEFWKITRVMDVSMEKTAGGYPTLKFAHRGSYVDTDTKKYDDEATRYMSYAMFPCVIGYFIYSLIYDKHKSWCASSWTAFSACRPSGSQYTSHDTRCACSHRAPLGDKAKSDRLGQNACRLNCST